MRVASTTGTSVTQGDAAVRSTEAAGSTFAQVVIARVREAEDAPAAQGSRDAVVEKAQKRRSALSRQEDPTSRAENVLAGNAQADPLGLQAAVQQEAVSGSGTPPAVAAQQGAAAERERGNEAAEIGEKAHDESHGRDESDEVTDQRAERASQRVSGEQGPRGGGNEAGNDDGGGFQQAAAGRGGTAQFAGAANEMNRQEDGGVGAIGGVARAAGSASVGLSGTTETGASSGTNSRAGGLDVVSALGALSRKSVFKLETPAAAKDVDPEAFAAQAAKGMAAAIKKEGGTVVMRLTPENLGLLSVKVETGDGAVSARVEASESAARDLLARHVDRLQAALEAHGVRVERIDVVRMGDIQGVSGGATTGTGGGVQQRARAGAETAAATGRMDASEFGEDTPGLTEEPSGLYLHGVELRVDAMA